MTKPIIQKELRALIEAAIETGSDYLALKDGLLFMPVRSFRNKGIFDLDFGLASSGSPISSIFSDVARRSAGADEEASRHFSSAFTKAPVQLPKASIKAGPAMLRTSTPSDVAIEHVPSSAPADGEQKPAGSPMAAGSGVFGHSWQADSVTASFPPQRKPSAEKGHADTAFLSSDETLTPASGSLSMMTAASSDTFTVMAAPPPPGGGAEPEEDPPTDIRFTGSLTIQENLGFGTSLGGLSANDASAITSYAVSGNGAIGARKIGSTNNWELYVKDNSLLNYEAYPNNQFTVTVSAIDQWGNVGGQTFTFTLTDVPEPPTNLGLSATDINENAPRGTFVGNLSGISNEGGPLFWSLTDPVGASTFRIVNNGTNNAYLEVLDPAALDYENGTHTLTFQMAARSANGMAWTYKTFTLALNDVNEPPKDLRIEGVGPFGSVSEGTQPGGRVARISVTDEPGDLRNLQWTISGVGAEYFDFDYASDYVSGLKLKQGVQLDMATLPSIPLTITVRDPRTNVTLEQSVTLWLMNANEAPVITVAAGKEGTIASTIGDVVRPFTGVTLADPDDLDLPNSPAMLTLEITFAEGRGALRNATSVTSIRNNPDNTVTYTFQGTASNLQEALHNIGFDPFDNAPGTTTFTLSLIDFGSLRATNTQVYVNAIANHPPTLTIDAGDEEVYLSDDQPAAPAFGNIWIGDDDDNDLTLTISFLNANGVLSGATGVDRGLSADGLIRTFEFHGKAAVLQDLLGQLKWNQTDGVVSNTRFTLTLSDGITTVTNNQRQVVINQAPTITFADGTEVTPAIDNGPPVKPFRGIDLNDRENDTLTVRIGFLDGHGVLAGATGATTHIGSDGLRYYTFQDKADVIDAILRNVTFDPRNGVANTTHFTISVEDGRHAPVLKQVKVVTSAAAGSTNAAPTIYVDPALDTFPATDVGPAVSPFLGVTLADAEDDILTVTVSFDVRQGFLLNVPNPQDATFNGFIVTHTIRGTASAVQNALHGLQFDPIDGQAGVTTFTITVKDDTHQAITNNQIKVVTEIAGGAGSNQAPVLDIIDGLETTHATDVGSPVAPFLGVVMSDPENDDVLVTLSFTDSHGTLGNLDFSSPLYLGTALNSDQRTYTFQGKAQDIQAFLRGLTFNPTDGVANTTNFSISIKDALHLAVENHEITVITSLNGGGGANAAPTITVASGWETVFAKDNGPAVYPFQGVHLRDEENDYLTVTVSFLDAQGVLGNAELGESTLANGIRTYTFTGRPAVVEAILHNLTFNPTDNSAAGGNVTTGFTITVKDDLHQAIGNNQIRVETSHGDGANAAPWISVPANRESTPATDTGPAVSPFSAVTLFDNDNDVLTLTVSFNRADGELRNTDAATGISDLNGVRTYTFTGRADVLQNILRGLTFDPTDGMANTTNFTIGLQDAYHAPVINNRIKVVTSLSGSTSNAAPTITVAVGTKVTDTSDIEPVAPFRGVDLFDAENDDLTVTVSFLHARGALSIPAGVGVTVVDNGIGNGGIRSFTLTGKADAIEVVLRAASFDPSDGTSNSTRFTISVKDAYHQAVTNQEIIVNSTAAGAPSAPTWSNGKTTISIDENSTTLPFLIQATDPNGDPIHYTLVSTPGSHNHYFIVDRDGQIRLAPYARLDFETTRNLDIYVRAIDSNGHEGPVQKLTVALNNVDEAPTMPVANDGVIQEGATGVVASVSESEDPERWGVTYEWDEDVPPALRNMFHLDADTGVISVVTALNYEANDGLIVRDPETGETYYELRIVARDDTGGPLSEAAVVKVYVTDVNEAPTDAIFSVVASIGENAPNDTIVASLVRVDDPDFPGPNEDFRFSLVRSATDSTAYTGPFTINPLTGQIKVSGALPDVSVPTSVTLYVKVADHGGVGNSYSIVRPITFTINPVTNNTPPTVDAPSATFTIADDENADLVKPFEGVTIYDPDTTDTITVTVTAIGEFGGEFIDALGSAHQRTYTIIGPLHDVLDQLRNLKFNPTDRPNAPSPSTDVTTFRINVQDGQGGSVSITPDIKVNSVHGAGNMVPDVSANGPIEWTTPDNIAVPAFQHLVFTDPDTDPETGEVTVEIWYDSGNGTLENVIAGHHDEIDGYYQITGTLQQVNEAVAALRFAPLNRPNGSASVTTQFLVKITDSGRAQDQITVTVHATSNDVPTSILLDGGTTDTVAESLGLNQVVGKLTATDENPSALTYSFVEGFSGAGRFWIDNTTKQIKVLAALNYEDPIVTVPGAGLEQETDGRKFYRLKVVASDGVNTSAPQEIKVYVTDVNEAPVLSTNNPTVSINETASNDDVVATFAVADEDENERFVYEILGLPDWAQGAFAVDAANKTIIVADATKLGVRQNETFTLTLSVKDKNGSAISLTDTLNFTVTINDTGDRPPVVNPQQIEGVPEDTGAGLIIGLSPLSAYDPDGDAITEFTVVGSNVPFTAHQIGSHWFLMVTGPLDYENAPHRDLETGKRWYEVQVTATAGGLTSAPQIIKVFIDNVEPDNTAPVIMVAPNGQLNWTVEDDTIVDPFQHLSFFDAEDGGNDDDPNTWIEVQIYFEMGQGEFVDPPDMSNFPGATLEFEPLLFVRGTADQVTAIVRGLHFHTRPRPEEEDDASEVTNFLVYVLDTVGALAVRQITVDSRAGNAQYNMMPTDIRLDGGTTDTVAESLGLNQVVGKLTATDENPAALTYSFVEGFSGAGRFWIDNTTKQIKVLAALDYEGEITSVPGAGLEQDGNGNKFYRLQVVASDGVNTSAPQEIIVYVTNVNEAPTFQAMDGGIISENHQQGTEVAELFASDPEGDTVTIRFVNGPGNGTISADGAFQIVEEIEETTGRVLHKVILVNQEAIQVGPDGELRDYDIILSDQHGASSTGSIAIRINDVPSTNTAPTNVRWATGGAVAENSGTDATVGTVTADDDGGASGLRYAIAANANFDIDAVTGRIFVKNGAVLNYEGTNSYTVAVTATDTNGTGLATTQNLTITLTDVNEAPTDLTFANQQALQAGATGANANVVQASWVDPDGATSGFRNNKYAFLVNGNLVTSDGKFTINAGTGQVTTNAALTAADAGTKTLQVVAYDAGNTALRYVEAYAVTVAPAANTAPTNVRWATGGAVAENSGTDATVGTVTADDDGGASGLRYAIAANANFDIDAVTGRIFVKNGAVLNYEGTNSYTVAVTATDTNGTGLATTQNLTITLTDVNEAPVLSTNNPAVSIAEFAANGDVVATFAVADPDANELFVYEITTVPAWKASAFAVDASDPANLKIVVANRNLLTVAQDETIALTLTVRDKNGGTGHLTGTLDYTVTILNDQGNLPPSNIRLDGGTTDTVAESLGVDQVVGTLTATDENPSALTYSFVEGFSGAGRFWIDNTTKQIKVLSALDYEGEITNVPGAGLEQDGSGNRFYRLKVVASDGVNTSAPQEIKVYVTNVNEALELSTDNTTVSIGETAANGDVLATVTITDPDENDRFTYEISGVPDWAAGAFGVNASDPRHPKIVVLNRTKLMVAQNETFTLTLTVKDNAGNPGYFFDTLDFTVTITDQGNQVPEEIFLDGSHADVVDESLGVDEVVGTLTAADDSPATLTYSFVEGFDGAGHFRIEGNQIKVRTALNFEDAITTVPGAGLEEDANGYRFYRLKVVATDSANPALSSTPQEIMVYVMDVNEAPTAVVVGDLATIRVGAEAGMLVVDVDAVDPDTVNPEFQDNVFKFRWSDGSLHDASEDGFFTIDADGKVRLAADVTADQLGSSHSFTVVAYMAGDPSQIVSSQEHTVVVQGAEPPADAAPVIGGLPTAAIEANANEGTVAPFAGVTIANEAGQATTATITFQNALGALSGAGLVLVGVEDGLATYTVTGTDAADLAAKLAALAFNPRDLAAGASEDIAFTVSLTDAGNPTAGAGQTGTVTVHSAAPAEPPANAAPVLWIAPGTETTNATDNGQAVYPFRGVDLWDAENDDLIVTISFAANAGDLLGAGNVQGQPSPDGQTITYTFQGKADVLDVILRGLSFNPFDDSAAGGPVNTLFTITVQDATHPPVSAQVTVHTTSGDDSGNLAPTITIADDSTDATDNGPAVKPFLTVDLSDAENDILTLTISFTDSHGVLGNTNGNLGTVNGDVRTFVFTGTADALDVLLRGLTFDPAQDLAVNGQVTTTFTIAVQDSTHPAVTDTVNVVTRHGDGTEPGSGNDPLDVTLTPNFVAENLADRVVGTLATVDPDVDDTFTYEIVGDGAGGRFEIASDGVSLKTVGGLDWESTDDLLKTDFFGKYYEVTVRSTDSYNRSLMKTLKVYVTDTADDPTNAAPVIGGAATPTSFTVGDNQVVAPFGSVTFFDPDSDTITVTIALDTASEGTFEGYTTGTYNALTGVYTVTGSVTEVQEAVQNLQFRTANRPDDPVGSLVITDFSITVSDGNSSVRNTNIRVVSQAVDDGDPGPLPDLLENKTILEHSGVRVAVGRLMSSNPATGETFTYELATDGDAGGRFMLDGNVLRVANSMLLDFEQQRLWDVKLIVTSSLRGQLEQTFTISLRNADTEFVEGGDSDDMFVSGAGADGLFGHGGNDTLVSGEGFDELWGGAGADAFVIDVYVEDGSSFDMIMDFDASEDRIELAADYFFTLALGNLDDNAFYILGSGEQTEQHQIVYDETTGELFYDMDGSGADATPILIAVLQNGSGGVPILSAANFLVVNNYWTA